MALRTVKSVESPSQFWDMVIRFGSVAAFFILAACLALPLRPRFAEYRELTEAGKVLDAEKASLEREIERREAELQMLERDKDFLAAKARDVLDMCRPGEVVFRFEDESGR